MEFVVDFLVSLLLLLGSFFFCVGTIGLLRMPDIYSKIHATTKCDSLGTGLILLGLMAYSGFTSISIKLLLILIFIWMTTPTAAHIIAKANYKQ